MAYFLFSDFLSSDESSDGPSVELATGSTPLPLSLEVEVGQPKLKSFRRIDSPLTRADDACSPEWRIGHSSHRNGDFGLCLIGVRM